MLKTISTQNGSKVCRAHNIRAEYVVSKETHIDTDLTCNNEILIDIPPEKAYQEIFGKALFEYNELCKHKGHSERCINDYYKHICKDKKKHEVYEMIIQIGDKDDTGLNADRERKCIKQFISSWKDRNPNLELIGAYIHADEYQGTLHAHLDYIPVAYNCKRGLSTQNALVKSLEQQGFKGKSASQTAQISWQRRENKALEEICIMQGIDIYHPIRDGEVKRKHLDTPDYKLYKERLDNLTKELKPLEEMSIKTELIDEKVKKLPFGKKSIVDTEAFETTKKQAKAYALNRDEIISLKSNQDKLKLDQEQLKKNREELKKAEKQLENERSTLASQREQLNQDYQRQLNLNQILEYTEQKLKIEKETTTSLTNENGSLKQDIEKQNKTIQQLKEKSRRAFESLVNVCKATSMLKYDNQDGYKANLTPQQERLVDGILNYSAYLTKQNGYSDLTEKINTTIGISNDIENEIMKLTPKMEEKKKEEPKKTRFSLDDLNSDKFAPRSRQTENNLKRKKHQELEL